MYVCRRQVQDGEASLDSGKTAGADDDSMSGEMAAAPYKLFLEHRGMLMPFPDGHDRLFANLDKGENPTVVIQWKDASQFKDYRGEVRIWSCGLSYSRIWLIVKCRLDDAL